MHTIFDYVLDAIFWLWPGTKMYDKVFFLGMLAAIVIFALMGDIAYAVFTLIMMILGMIVDALFPDVHKSTWFRIIEVILVILFLIYMTALLAPEFMSLTGK